MAFDKNFFKHREKMRRWDEKNVMDYAIKEAAKQAVKEAWEEEREKVVKQVSYETAQKMKEKGYPINDIMDITGLSVEEIHHL